MGCFTFREEPISMLDDGLNDGHHVDRCSCCNLRQRPGKKPDADVKTSQQQLNQTTELPRSYPSVFAHSRLGPRTMAMLLGVILFTSLS